MLKILFFYFFANFVSTFDLSSLRSHLNSNPNLFTHDVSKLSLQQQYDLSWYVVGQTNDFISNKPKKITVWNKDYVIWKNNNNFHACDNICPHRGASLAEGKVCNNNIICPYHGYEFNSNGELIIVPGLQFKPNNKFNIHSFDIIQQDGWVWLNTMINNGSFSFNLFREPETNSSRNLSIFKQVNLKQNFKCYPRILTENSLDIMHIGFVHTFGNRNEPAPLYENTQRISRWHYKTTYLYNSGEKSIPRVLFNISNITVENEFIMPHTTVARVIFNGMISTIITSVLPINDKQCTIFVKTYRNFIYGPIGDWYTSYAMCNTINEDRTIVENIDPSCIDGKYNMKFDKLQNIYRKFYKKYIHTYNH